MNVAEAVATRFSCRAFLDKPVDPEAIHRILDRARQSPSGGNVQPWHTYVLSGEAMDRFKALVQSRLPDNPRGEPPEFSIYPESLKEPYRSRRFKCGEDLYAAIGIPREDKPARLRQFARNLEWFGAPVGLFFALDRSMGWNQRAHLGMYMQTIMLLAREEGLHTCAQEAWSAWHKTVTEFLSLPDELMLYCGMAVGYADENNPINQWRTDRADMDEQVQYRSP